jgi:hypothetical protein
VNSIGNREFYSNCKIFNSLSSCDSFISVVNCADVALEGARPNSQITGRPIDIFNLSEFSIKLPSPDVEGGPGGAGTKTQYFLISVV